MITFLIGLAVLLVGGFFYGSFCEKLFGPDDRATPAVRLRDGVDFVPMAKWKNSLIQLLDIAGTGPVLGPIQGILFGPVAFITIPIGCVLGGALHDYMSGMISMREDGAQMPDLIEKHLGKKTAAVFCVCICVLMILVGAVFIYTPGDIFVTHILSQSADPSNRVVWFAYGAIFVYYLAATVFPIDKIIGRVYPVFGAILLLSAVGVFIGIFTNGFELDEIWSVPLFGNHPKALRFFPVFFVTVACGIVSGFHSTQATLVARTMGNEREGRMTFYNMMILEGFIAMVWAAAAMGVMKAGLADATTPATTVVGTVANSMLGKVGGLIALIGVIVLPITSGDTALRSLRLILADEFGIDQSRRRKRLALSAAIFAVVAALLVFAKLDNDGFGVLWRYFAWMNQTIAVFGFALITVYLRRTGGNGVPALIPGMFYMMIVTSFIANSKIGFNLPWPWAYGIGAALTVAYAVALRPRTRR